jgi:hypothetical protein
VHRGALTDPAFNDRDRQEAVALVMRTKNGFAPSAPADGAAFLFVTDIATERTQRQA